MKKIDKKFVILVDLIKNINIINVTLILAVALSFLSVNKYITFALVMLIAIILAEITQRIRMKYLGDSKSIFESKIFVFFTISLNIGFLGYYLFVKEYGIFALLVLFLIGYSLWKKVTARKNAK